MLILIEEETRIRATVSKIDIYESVLKKILISTKLASYREYVLKLKKEKILFLICCIAYNLVNFFYRIIVTDL